MAQLAKWADEEDSAHASFYVIAIPLAGVVLLVAAALTKWTLPKDGGRNSQRAGVAKKVQKTFARHVYFRLYWLHMLHNIWLRMRRPVPQCDG